MFLSHAERVTKSADDALASAQEAGVLLEPRIEFEHVETVLQLVGRGLGSTIAARAVLARSSVPESVAAGL